MLFEFKLFSMRL